jgi:hypothetical protein
MRTNTTERTMKSIRYAMCCCAVLSILVAGNATAEQAQSTHYDELAKLQFPGALPRRKIW